VENGVSFVYGDGKQSRSLQRKGGNTAWQQMGIEGSGSIEIFAIDLQSSLMLCLAWLKTSRGPTKSRASMPGCSVNNTLIMGMESVAAMVATEWLLRYSEVLGKWFE
jgi:hypothetical protein